MSKFRTFFHIFFAMNWIYWVYQYHITRARLRLVAPLGWPRSVYKSNVECNFLSRNDGQTLKIKVNYLHFQYHWANPKRHIWYRFGDSSSNPLQISWRQVKFRRILSQNVQNDLEGQGQWPPFSIPTESIPGCMFGANLVILAQICEDLSHRQAEFPRILRQNGQNDLEGQGQWPSFSIPAESIPKCMFGANLVILDQICDELSCGQGKVYGRMDCEFWCHIRNAMSHP